MGLDLVGLRDNKVEDESESGDRMAMSGIRGGSFGITSAQQNQGPEA